MIQERGFSMPCERGDEESFLEILLRRSCLLHALAESRNDARFGLVLGFMSHRNCSDRMAIYTLVF